MRVPAGAPGGRGADLRGGGDHRAGGWGPGEPPGGRGAPAVPRSPECRRGASPAVRWRGSGAEGDHGAAGPGVSGLRGPAVQGASPSMISKRVQGFTESVIREMTRVSAQYGGVNLAQGFPNFPPPRVLVEAAHRALEGDFHQYAITWGARNLREAIAQKF